MLALTLTFLVSCNKLPELELTDNGNYLDPKTGVIYIPAPGCYEPASVGQEYRRIGDDPMKTIGSLDPEKWLCEEKFKNVFYSSDIQLTPFEKMTVKQIKLCYEDVYAIEYASITDADEIVKVMDVYLHGEPGVGFAVTPEKVLSVKFVFEECPEIYYNLVYSCDLSTGEAYLTNRYEHKIIKADGLFDKYFTDSEDSGD